MPNEDLLTKKISRIRTFQSDISSVRPSAATASVVPVKKMTNPVKQSTAGQSIFRISKPSDIPVTKPQIAEEVKITEKTLPTPPVTVVSQKNELTAIVKEALFIPPVQKPLATPAKPSLEQMISKDTLTSMATTSEPSVITDDTSSEGSVITDQKKHRFNLLTSIVRSLEAWFVDEKESLENRAAAKKRSIPRVQPVEKRKEVLEKASQQSAIAPKDDHLQLATRFALPKAKTAEVSAPMQIKKKSAPQKPSWSHFTDNQKIASSEDKAVASTSSPVEIPEQKPVVVLPPLPTEKNPVEPKPESVWPTPLMTPTPLPPPLTKSSPQKVNESEPKPPEVKYVGKKHETKPSSQLVRTFLTYFGIAAVVIAAVAGGMTLVWWLSNNINLGSSNVSLTKENIPPARQELVTYDDKVDVSLPHQKTDLWQSVLNAKTRAGSDLVLVTPVNLDNTPATAAEILEIIDWQTNTAFLRSIEKINLGKYRDEPFIVMRVTNFDTAFGSLLSAEANLAKDLNIFIKNETEPLAAKFNDELIQNHDIRVLKKESGEDVLVYGFVNINTIVITSDRNTFVEVTNRLR